MTPELLLILVLAGGFLVLAACNVILLRLLSRTRTHPRRGTEERRHEERVSVWVEDSRGRRLTTVERVALRKTADPWVMHNLFPAVVTVTRSFLLDPGDWLVNVIRFDDGREARARARCSGEVHSGNGGDEFVFRATDLSWSIRNEVAP